MLRTIFPSFVTVLYKITGCFLLQFWLKRGATAWLLIPAGVSLVVSAQLLMLHPAVGGRVYVAYGGAYVVTALLWLRTADGVKLSLYGWSDTLVALCGMLIIVAGWGRV